MTSQISNVQIRSDAFTWRETFRIKSQALKDLVKNEDADGNDEENKTMRVKSLPGLPWTNDPRESRLFWGDAPPADPKIPDCFPGALNFNQFTRIEQTKFSSENNRYLDHYTIKDRSTIS